MRKAYEDLDNYELTMLELGWTPSTPEEEMPDGYEGWKAYYDRLPDEKAFATAVDGLQLQADDSGPIRIIRCVRCHEPVSFVAIYGLKNEYLGDGFTCPNCAQARITVIR